MATLSFDQVVNIIKNHSTVPCFILVSNNIGEYNPNNWTTPDIPQLTHFAYDNFYLAPELANLPVDDINAIQEYLDSDTPYYTDLYIIPLYKLKEVLGTFETKWQQFAQEDFLLDDDDYFYYIPNMLEEFLQLVWAYTKNIGLSFKDFWNTYNKTIFEKFINAHDFDPDGYDEYPLSLRFETAQKTVNEGKVDYSFQYIA